MWKRRRVEPGELDGAGGQDFRVQDGDRDERGDDGGLRGEGDERRPAVVAAQKWRGFDERFLKHGGTSKVSMCAFRRGTRLHA